MSPMQAAAEYAAYSDYLEQPENAGRTAADAHTFSALHWPQYIGQADIGFGRLLLAMKNGRDADGTPFTAEEMLLDVDDAEFVCASRSDADFELLGV